jgi:hypothetical protein
MAKRDARWVDPAPLEVARPRLPWWTLVPTWVKVVGSPIIAAWLTCWLLWQTGRAVHRHFYASVLLAQGVSIKELADYLGHADPGFMLRTYTHLVPSSHERARVAVDGVFGRSDATDGLEAA